MAPKISPIAQAAKLLAAELQADGVVVIAIRRVDDKGFSMQHGAYVERESVSWEDLAQAAEEVSVELVTGDPIVESEPS